jgi:putative alpha-1,2-mannosidase
MSTVRRLAVTVAVAIACAACTSTNEPAATAPEPDAEDVFCDPVDALEDDATPETETPVPLTQWVDPFVGTGGLGFGTGSAYPGPQVPYGMAKPGPDTSRAGRAVTFAHCAGYAYGDDTIEGFSNARLHGAGIADYGGIALMPATTFAPSNAGPRKHGSPFSHATERASPGYYAVTLGASEVKVELTATARVAVHRYTFPEAVTEPIVFVDAGHAIADGNPVADAEIVVDAAGREVSGFSHVSGGYSRRFGGARLYFVVRFDRAPATSSTYAGGIVGSALDARGADAGAVLRFDASTNVVVAHVGLSFVDVAHARANLDAEAAPFEDVRRAAKRRGKNASRRCTSPREAIAIGASPTRRSTTRR